MVANQHSAVGRRKTSVARVYLRPGNGKFVINKKPLEDYVPLEWKRRHIMEPLRVTESEGKFDVIVNAKGGGITGQLDAVRLGISRALVKDNEENRKLLREVGLLTRDPRMVERKKYGQPKARKKFQFSKR